MWSNSIQFEGNAFDIHLKYIYAIEREKPVHSGGILMNDSMIKKMSRILHAKLNKDGTFPNETWFEELKIAYSESQDGIQILTQIL